MRFSPPLRVRALLLGALLQSRKQGIDLFQPRSSLRTLQAAQRDQEMLYHRQVAEQQVTLRNVCHAQSNERLRGEP